MNCNNTSFVCKLLANDLNVCICAVSVRVTLCDESLRLPNYTKFSENLFSPSMFCYTPNIGGVMNLAFFSNV